jgi:hypothetical protein
MFTAGFCLQRKVIVAPPESPYTKVSDALSKYLTRVLHLSYDFLKVLDLYLVVMLEEMHCASQLLSIINTNLRYDATSYETEIRPAKNTTHSHSSDPARLLRRCLQSV